MADWERAKAIADAVLYEGYLLYPYRATSAKNRSRWQFGVLGPPGAAAAGLGEDDSLSAEFLVRGATGLRLVVRFLHLVHRRAERATDQGYTPVDELPTPDGSWLTWDEAAETEFSLGPLDLGNRAQPWTLPLHAQASREEENLDGGRLVRERQGVHAAVSVSVRADGELDRVTLTLANTGANARDHRDAICRSLIGAHVIAQAVDGDFVSLLEPPARFRDAAQRCRQHRCFPVLAGPAGASGDPGRTGASGDPGHTDDLLLISPIILYDHPEIAEQSRGALYDSTEIDEILTLRVMTMTDEEKAQARATDPLAARIIEQCDGMSAEEMLNLHGVLRDPHAGPEPPAIPELPDDVDWWSPEADAAVRPDCDAVLVNGVRVARGCRVRLQPRRRADAQDMFVAGRTARVAAVHEDVDGRRHVAVVVDDDPAADLHEWYGRYLYFSPEEIEPLDTGEFSTEFSTERNPTWT